LYTRARLLLETGCSIRASHLDTQEVAKADLGDIVTDVLIVLKISIGDVGCARKLGSVGLFGVRELRFQGVREDHVPWLHQQEKDEYIRHPSKPWERFDLDPK